MPAIRRIYLPSAAKCCSEHSSERFNRHTQERFVRTSGYGESALRNAERYGPSKISNLRPVNVFRLNVRIRNNPNNWSLQCSCSRSVRDCSGRGLICVTTSARLGSFERIVDPNRQGREKERQTERIPGAKTNSTVGKAFPTIGRTLLELAEIRSF